MTGYTVEYSSDQMTWISQNVGPSIHSVAIDGLTNGTTYFVRVRAETNLHGLWSVTSTALTPRAPVVPLASPSPTPSRTPALYDAIRQSVMPVTLAPATTLRTSSGSVVTVTTDGRIELAPTQSIALLNGAPVLATVVEQGQNLKVSAASVDLQVTFEGAAGQTNHEDELALVGSGFAPNSPVVAWIQSSPRKLADTTANADGSTITNFVIPADLELGHHTLQFNGVRADGQVLSVAYGIEIVPNDDPQTGGVAFPWALVLALLIALIVGVITLRRIRARVQ